jgi:hypothetical protein
VVKRLDDRPAGQGDAPARIEGRASEDLRRLEGQHRVDRHYTSGSELERTLKSLIGG